MPLPVSTRRRHLLLAALPAPGAASAQDAPLHVLVDGSIEMPQARFKDGQAVEGLQVELAQEIARRLGRPVAFHLVPRRRVAPMLTEGRQADLICNYLPAWLPGPLRWSRAYLDDADLLVTAARHAAPARLADLAGHPIGTVSGFLYPDVAAALGVRFVRDDAPNAAATLRKLALGRVDHALVGRVTFDYMMRRGDVPIELHPPLVVARFRTGCALSPRSAVRLGELDDALAAMQTDGSLGRILDRYR
jgi:ABC-type amino acid transport substrate-binding protein